jgi:hypothetical protein
MRAVLNLAALALATPAHADFAVADLTRVDLSRFDAGRWSAKQEAARITLACTACEELTAIDIQLGDDDGTEGRIRSGQTTAESMSAIGRANAARSAGAGEYFGAEAIRRGAAVGFRQEARALGQFITTYILWDGGKRLIIRGSAPDRAVSRRIAQEGYDKVAAQMAR